MLLKTALKSIGAENAMCLSDGRKLKEMSSEFSRDKFFNDPVIFSSLELPLNKKSMLLIRIFEPNLFSMK